MFTFTMRFLKPLNGVLSCLTTREDASCEVASIYWFAQRLAMAHQIHPNLSFVSAEFVGGTEPDTRMHRRKDEPAVKQEVGSLARCAGGHPTFESSMSSPDPGLDSYRLWRSISAVQTKPPEMPFTEDLSYVSKLGPKSIDRQYFG